MSRYPQPGTVLLGKYLVESLIGEGGMGAVIKARHIELDEPVAIKCLLPDMMSRADIVARFLREAKAAAKLKGEHVARVHDVGRLDDQVPYIVMEYLDGADLNAIIKHYGAQDPAVATDLMLQACEAIAEAHSLGIIHRDVKASNFFVTQPANHAPVLKVLDFGIATAPEGTSDLTSTQSVIGTPAYMAPEQMRSSRTADARSDIWSIGVVLYELLEGKRPFLSEVYSELCLKVGMDPPEPMVAPHVPEGLRAVVLKCLEKPVERRYQSVAELAFDLMPFGTDTVAARALVEQCARLLGRRSSRIATDASRNTPRPPMVGDATPLALAAVAPPGPKTPSRITPAGPLPPLHAHDAADDSDDADGYDDRTTVTPVSVSMVLGRPTPSPGTRPSEPTSIGAGSGEVASVRAESAPVPELRGRGWTIAIAAVAMLAIGGVGLYAFGRTGDDASVQSATQPSTIPAANPDVPTPPPAPAPAMAPAPVAPVATVTPPPPPPPQPPPVKPTPPPPPALIEPKPKPVQPAPANLKKAPPAKPAAVTPKKPADPADIYTKRQ